MTSKILAILALFLVATMASARRSSPSSRRAFLGPRSRRGVSIPKLFDNRQVIAMEASSNKVVKQANPSMEAEDYSSRVRDELVYLSFHGF